jgi:hypothetical protein
MAEPAMHRKPTRSAEMKRPRFREAVGKSASGTSTHHGEIMRDFLKAVNRREDIPANYKTP